MRILVTGGTGMVGQHLQKILPDALFIGSEFDLRDWITVNSLVKSVAPDCIIHLAARVGGIQENIEKPAEFFDDNILMNTNILKASHKYNVNKFIYKKAWATCEVCHRIMKLGVVDTGNFSVITLLSSSSTSIRSILSSFLIMLKYKLNNS